MQPTRINPIRALFPTLASLSLLCAGTPLAAQDQAGGGVAGGPEVIGQSLTYQGVIKQGGTPINGACDLRFGLWTAASGPAQVGSTQEFLNQSVGDGLVTIDLDFGAGAFDGNDRWIEVAVRFPAGGGSYTTLVPRQKVNAAPYALWALSGAAGLTLPYSGSAGSLSPLFSLTNSSTGPVMRLTGTPSSAWPFAVLHVDGGNFNGGIYASSGSSEAVVGDSPSGHAVAGYSNTGLAFYGLSNGTAIHGLNGATGNLGQLGTATEGVRGQNGPANTLGILGGPGAGVYGEHAASGNYGRLGHADYGVYGEAAGNTDIGVRGFHNSSGAHGSLGMAIDTGEFGFVGVGVYGSGATGGVFTGTGIGVSATGANFGVAGTSTTVNGTGVFGHGGGFDFFAGGPGVNYGTSSSIRWKDNVHSIDGALDKVVRLRGVYFDWDAEHGGHHDVGMIAEEVGAVLPEIVVYEENGVDALGMDYSKLTPLLVEAMRELRNEKDQELAECDDQVAARQREIEALKAQVAALQSMAERLARLESQERFAATVAQIGNKP